MHAALRLISFSWSHHGSDCEFSIVAGFQSYCSYKEAGKPKEGGKDMMENFWSSRYTKKYIRINKIVGVQHHLSLSIAILIRGFVVLKQTAKITQNPMYCVLIKTLFIAFIWPCFKTICLGRKIVLQCFGFMIFSPKSRLSYITSHILWFDRIH